MPRKWTDGVPAYPPRVEVWVQDPARQGFVLGRSPLGGLTPLGRGTSERPFTLGQDTLGRGRLGPLGAAYTWLDIAQWASEVTTYLGVRNGFEGADAGTLEVFLRNPPNLESLPLYVGTPIRVIQKIVTIPGGWPVTREAVIWAGTVEDWVMHHNPASGTTNYTLTATDGVAALGAQSLAGLADHQTLGQRDRINWLLREAQLSGISVQVIGDTGYANYNRNLRVDSETRTVAEHITLTAAAAGMTWALVPNEALGAAVNGQTPSTLRLMAPGRPSGAPKIGYSDLPKDDEEQLGLDGKPDGIYGSTGYSGIKMAGGTKTMGTAVELESVGDGGTSRYVLADETAVANYGARPVKIKGTTRPEHVAGVAAATLAYMAVNKPVPTEVTVPGELAYGRYGDLSPLPLSVGDIRYRSARYKALVRGVEHKWTIQNKTGLKVRHEVTLTLGRVAEKE